MTSSSETRVAPAGGEVCGAGAGLCWPATNAGGKSIAKIKSLTCLK